MKEEKYVLVWMKLTGAALCLSGLSCFLELVFRSGSVWLLFGLLSGIFGLICLRKMYCIRKKQMDEKCRENEMRIAQIQLDCKQKMEEVRKKSQQEAETFRSGLAHSLRMPVAIIQGYVELLCGDMVEDPDVRREYMEKIVQRTQYMTDIMNRHFSPESGLDVGKLSCERLDLVELVCREAEDMQAAAAEKSIRIQVITAEDTLFVDADGYLLKRALYNLIENSIKYMGRAGTITIRMRKEEEMAMVSVRDDGFGLSPEETKHIFKKSCQGSNRLNTGGYGLYLVKETVEAHGGTISAQSRLGQGMKITFQIPLERKK